jgi:hypothetical protein
MSYISQNELLLNNLKRFYNNEDNLNIMLKIITGESRISLRIVDWFATNYSKKNYTLYSYLDSENKPHRFKVYNDYKLKLKAYSKRRFDPFCRWERIYIPYKNNTNIETTIGQLNFFKWTIENKVIDYIEENYDEIEKDMTQRNTSSHNNLKSNIPSPLMQPQSIQNQTTKTRKKREEISVSAAKTIYKEDVEIVLTF